jgi:hypothetical protein
MRGKHSITQAIPLVLSFVFCFLRQGLTYFALPDLAFTILLSPPPKQLGL